MIWTRTRLIARLRWRKGESDQVQFLNSGVKQSGRLFQPESRNSKAKLFSQVIIRTKHIHSNNFHLTTNDSIIFKKVIPDDSLCSSFKNSDDIELFKILCNEAHLHLPIETVTPLTVSTSQVIIFRRWEKSCLKWKSLSLRITVDDTRDLVILLNDRSFIDHHFWVLIALKTAFFQKDSSRYAICFKVRDLRRFLKVIFLHLASAVRARWGVVVQFSNDIFVVIPINNAKFPN